MLADRLLWVDIGLIVQSATGSPKSGPVMTLLRRRHQGGLTQTKRPPRKSGRSRACLNLAVGGSPMDHGDHISGGRVQRGLHIGARLCPHVAGFPDVGTAHFHQEAEYGLALLTDLEGHSKGARVVLGVGR